MGRRRKEEAGEGAAARGEGLGDGGEEENDSEDDVSEAPNLGRARLEQRGLVSFESLARSKEFVTENGERVAAASAIEVFGGLLAFLERRQRLGR